MHFNIEWIGPIATAVGVLGGFIWWAVRGHIDNRHLRKDVEQRDTAIAKQQKMIERLEEELANDAPTAYERQLRAQVANLTEVLQKVRADRDRIIAKGDELVEVYKDLRRRTQADLARLAHEKKLTEEQLKGLAESNETFNERIANLVAQIDAMREQDGRLWERPVDPAKASPFRPRSERGFPIISILNLKGGVGKTTITAHLAGALGLKGKKVLMVDLDYQRSLSMMTIPSQQRTILSLQSRCLQHFLGGDDHGAKRLLDCVRAVGDGMKNCSIVTNSDARDEKDSVNSLEETEARLLAEWTVQNEGGDIRLLLREALHAPEMSGKFDYVLLDCPPRLTTACINALAASDFVLIPVVLDALSARSVPELLRSLQRLREPLLPHLEILGVVANMVTLRSGDPVQQEAEVWQKLQFGLGGTWPQPVPFCKTKIPNKARFGLAAGSLDEGELRLALKEEAIQKCFSQLIAEIEKDLKNHERRYSPAIPS